MSQNVDSRFRCEKDKQNKCREKSAESNESKEASSDIKINFFLFNGDWQNIIR